VLDELAPELLELELQAAIRVVAAIAANAVVAARRETARLRIDMKPPGEPGEAISQPGGLADVCEENRSDVCLMSMA
jgi:hypothetical protein